MQKIIQIYPCLLKLSRKQDTILNIGDFSTKHICFFKVKQQLYLETKVSRTREL
jgi:hypothetical protein